jgi:CRISPR-associated protein Cas1
VVEYEDRTIAEMHDFKVERVVVFGNVQLTSQAIAFLLDRGIDTAFLSMRGRLKGRLAPLESKNSLLRLQQYERAVSTEFVSRQTNARTSFRRALYEQALVMQRTVMQGAAYQPFQGWH